MTIDILTLFPKMFKGPFAESIVKRAQEKGLVEIKIHDLRHWTRDKRKTVDDRPYGGGTGMIMMIQPIYRALRKLKTQNSKVILLSPSGKVFNQKKAQQLAKINHLILICGHYEGVDQRVVDYLVDEEISIGDYILTGGEIPAMAIVDSIVRLLPGVLAKPEAIKQESFSDYYHTTVRGNSTLLEYPQYTRPIEYKGWKVPNILISGNHKKIQQWRTKKALEKTKKVRPDLLKVKIR